MHRTGRPQTARQRFPLAAGAQHRQNGRHRLLVVHPGPTVFLPGFERREDAHHLPPQGIRDLIVRPDPKGVVTHLGSLPSVNGGTNYTVFTTFRIGSKLDFIHLYEF
jgi:hypothetical protein